MTKEQYIEIMESAVQPHNENTLSHYKGMIFGIVFCSIEDFNISIDDYCEISGVRNRLLDEAEANVIAMKEGL